jgi:hypothetical protein
MKLGFYSLPIAFMLAASYSWGQSTFVYDQQSADENTSADYEGISGIQSLEPVGQSFTPSLQAVGFIRLDVGDNFPGNGLGATMDVLLRSDSITGPVIGTSDSVTMPDGYGNFTDFFFSTPVTVTPGVTYYFQPEVESGDSWAIVSVYSFLFPGGTGYYNGTANSYWDLWFREGTVNTPEPSSVALLLLGGGAFALFRRAKAKAALG